MTPKIIAFYSLMFCFPYLMGMNTSDSDGSLISGVVHNEPAQPPARTRTGMGPAEEQVAQVIAQQQKDAATMRDRADSRDDQPKGCCFSGKSDKKKPKG